MLESHLGLLSGLGFGRVASEKARRSVDDDESNTLVITSEVIFVGFNNVVGSDLIPEYLWSGAEVMRAFQFPLHLLNLTKLT